MGNEYVFQSYAEQNVATLNEAGVTKIVASCPHCLNSLGNEYPDFGGRYEVMHHTRAPGRARARRQARAGARRRRDHLPRLVLPGPPQRRARRAARARRRGRQAGRDAAERQAHLLLRRRRRAHVDGGARLGDQRGARARSAGDRGRDARGRLPVLHRDARRRRARRPTQDCASPTSRRCSSSRSTHERDRRLPVRGGALRGARAPARHPLLPLRRVPPLERQRLRRDGGGA